MFFSLRLDELVVLLAMAVSDAAAAAASCGVSTPDARRFAWLDRRRNLTAMLV